MAGWRGVASRPLLIPRIGLLHINARAYMECVPATSAAWQFKYFPGLRVAVAKWTVTLTCQLSLTPPPPSLLFPFVPYHPCFVIVGLPVSLSLCFACAAQPSSQLRSRVRPFSALAFSLASACLPANSLPLTPSSSLPPFRFSTIVQSVFSYPTANEVLRCCRRGRPRGRRARRLLHQPRLRRRAGQALHADLGRRQRARHHLAGQRPLDEP